MSVKPVPVDESYARARERLLQFFSKLATMKGYSSIDYATFMDVVQKYLDKFIAGEVAEYIPAH